MLAENEKTFLHGCLPFWNALSEKELALLLQNTVKKDFAKGDILTRSGKECAGLVVVYEGQLRAYMTSEEGKEITLYRLLPRDICIMTAACMLKNLNFEITLEIEKDSTLIIIPTKLFENLYSTNTAVKEFSMELITSKFTDVMWVVEQLVFSSFGKRLAALLIEQSTLEGSNVLTVTHDMIARDLGSAREVVTRGLKQFHLEGMVELSRSKITITDLDKLHAFSR